ncbi:hypothetical protein CVT26_002989 [Gymnopilus dilepis]|uniref:BZIP domain-containing protein n=1 Tax=Gymnopilus dilepis TaxID=231916 RepID=A0A409Y4L4_9AGAR|nr:hypothetical protein CVT26_002989 [Gymnopilus dilepis]
MSFKGGRKRNDNLPPTRARDVQRAFRARRAAHLQALEQRISELEEENGCLRQALNLPPSTRPPLGRGPTGIDKPKPYDRSRFQSLSLLSGHDSSSADCPTSRVSSESPLAATVSMFSRSMTVVELSAWNDTIKLVDHQQPQQPQQHQQQQHHSQPELTTPSEPAYHIAPIPIKPIQCPTYSTTFPSASRSLSNNLYTAPTIHHPHSSDRPLCQSYNSHDFDFLQEIPEEHCTHYSYLQTFPSHDANMHNQTPPPPDPAPIHTHIHAHHHNQRESPISYHPQGRAMTDPHGLPIGESISHLPNPAQIPSHPRTPD